MRSAGVCLLGQCAFAHPGPSLFPDGPGLPSFLERLGITLLARGSPGSAPHLRMGESLEAEPASGEKEAQQGPRPRQTHVIAGSLGAPPASAPGRPVPKRVEKRGAPRRGCCLRGSGSGNPAGDAGSNRNGRRARPLARSPPGCGMGWTRWRPVPRAGPDGPQAAGRGRSALSHCVRRCGLCTQPSDSSAVATDGHRRGAA